LYQAIDRIVVNSQVRLSITFKPVRGDYSEYLSI